MSMLEQIEAEVAADPQSVGLILRGSRAAGVERADSDFDLIRVVTGESRRGEREKRHAAGSPDADVVYTTAEGLRALAEAPDWRTGMFVTGRVLVDNDGQLQELSGEIVRKAGEHAFAGLPELYDGYLNCFVRSLKAWRRGDELGGRMQAAESSLYLVRLLFALERRWPPYHDQLSAPLGQLEAAQGWESGFLSDALLVLLSTGDPTSQQELELRVEALLDSRGVAHEWGPEDDLQPLKEHPFR